MKDDRTILRKVAKVPARMFIHSLQYILHYKMYDKWNLRLRLEHLFGLYERETTRYFKKHIKKGMTIVDVGANVGYYTRIFSKCVGKKGKVYAFEPDEEAYSYLKYNTEQLKNVVLIPYAVSDVEGEADFYHILGATSSHTLIPIDRSEIHTVKTVTLDSYISDKIDIIKMDIEGAEDKVFRGMKRHLEDAPWVVFEYTKVEGDALLSELRQSGNVFSITQAGDLQEVAKAEYYPVGRGGNPYANFVYRRGAKSELA